MNLEIHDSEQYIISFIMGEKYLEKYISYKKFGRFEDLPEQTKIVIVKSNFFDENIYGSLASLPETPFSLLPETDIPFLFGEPRIEKTLDGKIILYADLVASSYYMLSRYEEIIKPNSRDHYGRFLSKDSLIFQQGYGMRPLVDEWGRYLRNLLRKSGVELPEEKHGFSKIYLTHDIDRPFLLRTSTSLLLQIIKNLIKKGTQIKNPIKAYITGEGDPFNTFSWIVEQDNSLIKNLSANIVQPIYFIISGKSNSKNKYHSVRTFKYKKILKFLLTNKVRLGLHVSHEGGDNPQLIKNEIFRLPKCVDKENLLSRHHYLKWKDPIHIKYLEEAGIKEDFTLGYADSVGFRCGTCNAFKVINPYSKEISNLIEHPLLIMECSLDAKKYMDLNEDSSFNFCKKIIDKVFDFNGELDMLFHNSSFDKYSFHINLYKSILKYITNKYKHSLGI